MEDYQFCNLFKKNCYNLSMDEPPHLLEVFATPVSTLPPMQLCLVTYAMLRTCCPPSCRFCCLGSSTPVSALLSTSPVTWLFFSLANKRINNRRDTSRHGSRQFCVRRLLLFIVFAVIHQVGENPRAISQFSEHSY